MDRKEYMKAYRKTHQEQFKNYRKKWRQANKDKEEYKAKCAGYTKSYYQRKKISTDDTINSTNE